MKRFNDTLAEYKKATSKGEAMELYNKAISSMRTVSAMQEHLTALAGGNHGSMLQNKNVMKQENFSRLSNAVGNWLQHE